MTAPLIVLGALSQSLELSLRQCAEYEVFSPKRRMFSNGEIEFSCDKDLKKRSIILIHTVATHDLFVECLLLIELLKKRGALRVSCIFPYLFYGRQAFQSLEKSSGLSLIVNALGGAGCDHISVIDTHEGGVQKNGRFIYNVLPASLWALDSQHHFREEKKTVIVSPDKGGAGRAEALGKILDYPTLCLEKTRDKGKIKHTSAKDVKGKVCLLVDDMIDSGATLKSAARFLSEKGAAAVHGYVTHGLFSKDIKSAKELNLSSLVLSNSLMHPLIEMCRVLDLTPLIKDQITLLLKERASEL